MERAGWSQAARGGSTPTWRLSPGFWTASRHGSRLRWKPAPSATCDNDTRHWRARRSDRLPIPSRRTSSISPTAISPRGLRLPVAGTAAGADRVVEKAGPYHPTQLGLAAALASSRVIVPGYSNWLLFSANVETALAMTGEPWDTVRIDYALRKHAEWFVGDGLYGDGPSFHWDYYNSFVIQPMLLDTLRNIGPYSSRWQRLLPDVLARARRYAAIQERPISPDGTFPTIGRSITYRCGAFHLLALMALGRELPEPLTGPQVRCALTALMRRMMEAPGTFDGDGWLRIGFCGHRPKLGENYISTGSLYLCATVLLPLGLSPADPFWAGPAQDWTSRRTWSGEDMPAEHAL